MKPCVLIPSYNTGSLLRTTVAGALAVWEDVFVVIDGSTDGSDAELENLTNGRGGLRILRLPVNCGKGAAVLKGIALAQAEGFTHALTMDSDGQHPADHIRRFMKTGKAYPEALVLGEPVFDAAAPALRVNGRKVSNLLANLETGWWGIHDSLFGMRLYPIAPLLEVFSKTAFARRFDFDPEVAVRLCWSGVPVINLKTPVRYLTAEEGGVSQFRYLRDNTLLTGMHFRLFFGFLVRIPALMRKGRNPLKDSNFPTNE